MSNFIRLFIFILISSNSFFSQTSTEYKTYSATIAFYNLENLFDTINDPNIDDEEFLPNGKRNWKTENYIDKLDKLSKVIDKLGDDNGPEILGVCEVENKQVLIDLTQTLLLRPKAYSIIHFDSPDKRGIDVALLFKSKYFKPLSSTIVNVRDTSDLEFTTRSQLIVTGVLSNDTICFVVNHWPSRRGALKDTKRILAAKKLRHIVDSLSNVYLDCKIIAMGDFNDNPNDRSIMDYLNAKPQKKMSNKSLFNPMYSISQKGYGSLMHDGVWNLFDQLILSSAFLKNPNNKYYYLENSASVYYHKWLINQEGKYAGGPFRSFSGSQYIGGYSDHLPVYLHLVQKVNANN